MTTAHDLLLMAKAIHADHADETGARTSVNRAYYAAYHLAKGIDEKHQLPAVPTSNTGSHQRLYDRLMNCPLSEKEFLTIKSIGYTASKILKPARVKSDYEISSPLPSCLPEETIAKVENLFNKATETKLI